MQGILIRHRPTNHRKFSLIAGTQSETYGKRPEYMGICKYDQKFIDNINYRTKNRRDTQSPNCACET